MSHKMKMMEASGQENLVKGRAGAQILGAGVTEGEGRDGCEQHACMQALGGHFKGAGSFLKTAGAINAYSSRGVLCSSVHL